MSRSKREKAVALKYNAQQDAAPVVIASGYGSVAEKIIQVAEGKGIPVFRDDSAASLLCMLEVGAAIPPELYQVVAAVYCRLLELSAQVKQAGGQPSGAAPAAPARPSRQRGGRGRRGDAPAGK